MILFLSLFSSEDKRNKLEEVYSLYVKDLIYIANSILHDIHEAEDVVQTAILKFSEYLDKIDDVKCHKTKGLIVIIVRRLSFNIYNQRKKRPVSSIDELGNTLYDEETDPEYTVLRLNDYEKLAKKLAVMNEDHADILTLKYKYEYTNSEIAEICGISEENVRQRISRAKEMLRRIISGEING